MTWQSIAIPFIQGFESCELTAYHGAADRPGLYTCGWGSTGPDVTADTVWTQAQADARFANDLEIVGVQVDNHVKVALTDQMAEIIGLQTVPQDGMLQRNLRVLYEQSRNTRKRWDRIDLFSTAKRRCIIDVHSSFTWRISWTQCERIQIRGAKWLIFGQNR